MRPMRPRNGGKGDALTQSLQVDQHAIGTVMLELMEQHLKPVRQRLSSFLGLLRYFSSQPQEALAFLLPRRKVA